MPLVQCPNCGATYKIPLDRVGRDLRCRHCPTTFVAEPRRSGPRSKSSAPPARLILYGFILLGAIVMGFLAMRKPSDKGASDTASASQTGLDGNIGAEADDESRASAASRNGALPHERARPSPSATHPDSEVESFVQAFLLAVEGRDAERLQQIINFAAFWQDDPAASTDQRTWADLPDWQRAAKREQYVEALLAEEDGAAPFVDRSALDSIEVTHPPGAMSRTRVSFTLRDPETREFQERQLAMVRTANRWFLAGHQAGPIRDPEAEEASRLEAERRKGLADLDIIVSHKLTDEAPIETQEQLEETTPAQKAEVARAVRLLVDLAKTREAARVRKQLVGFGRPTVVGLLNALVPLDLADQDDRMRANRCIQVLQDMTGESFGFSPMGVDGRLDAEALAINTTALRRWFGWWRDNKRSWKPPEKKPEEPSRRRRRRRRVPES